MDNYQWQSPKIKQWLERELKRPYTLSNEDWLYIAFMFAVYPIAFGIGLLIGLIVILLI